MSRGLSLHHLCNIGLTNVSRGSVPCAKKDAVQSSIIGSGEKSSMHSSTHAQRSLRVLSFNVLFPNSETSGVWWIYKYYNAGEASCGSVNVSDWGHRSMLLGHLIERIGADIVCFQEPWNCRGVPKVDMANSTGKEEDVTQATFKSDFAFMEQLGYDAELCGKGQIRTATFWKIDSKSDETKVAQGQVCPHRSDSQKPISIQRISSSSKVNRALVSLFEVGLADDAKKQHVAIVNCHLTADPTKQRDRVSTVEDGVKEALKMFGAVGSPNASAPKSKKGKTVDEPSVASPPVSVIVCGDFNSPAGGPVEAFLTTGEVGPDESIGLSKRKAHSLPKFIDCGMAKGPTFVASNVDTLMLRPSEKWNPLPASISEQASILDATLKNATGRMDEDGELRTSVSLDNEILQALNEQRLTPEMLNRVRQCFDRVKQTPSGLPEGAVLSQDEISGKQVKWWLNCVNGGMRGTEFRRSREMQLAKLVAQGLKPAPDQDDDLLPSLTFQEFATATRLECEEGKYWGVEHDLQKLCGCGMRKPRDISYQERFDYIYVSSDPSCGLRLAAADVPAFFPQAVGGEDGTLKSLVEIGLASGGIDSFVLPNSWHPSDHLPVVAEFTL